MNTEPAHPPLPPAGLAPLPPAGPLVPPPPPRAGKRRRRRRGASGRWLLWTACLGLGIGLGIAAYQWVPDVDFYFDYWVALALG